MSTFTYVHPDGYTVEREAPIGKAPKFIVVGGRRCERGVEMPARVALDAFKRGERPMVSRQPPAWYGFRDRDECYRQYLNARGVDYTPERQKALVKIGKGPTPAQQNAYARKRAIEAGAAGEFDRKGRVMATTRRGEWNHVARGREMGDTLSLDRA